ncbi:Mechanosensitive ion channel [seawater metagenome]|uniref:Mechanosensitive ion channel n=1 Tax=seawater metagenome TaxID=1561972 RepID=A0A5E8CKW3_9ZZZZ
MNNAIYHKYLIQFGLILGKIIFFLIFKEIFYQILYFLFFKYIVDKVESERTKFLYMIKVIYYGTLSILILVLLGITKAKILTYISGLSLVLAYVVQDIISDLFHGFLIMFTNPIEINDYLEIDDKKGYVKSIELLRVKIIDVDNKEISIPNSYLIKNNFKRISQSSSIFMQLGFGIPYQYPYQNVKEKIEKIINDLKIQGYLERDDKELRLFTEKFSVNNYQIDLNENKLLIKNLDNLILYPSDLKQEFEIEIEDPNIDNLIITLEEIDEDKNIYTFSFFNDYSFDSVSQFFNLILNDHKSISIRNKLLNFLTKRKIERSNVFIKSFDDSAVTLTINLRLNLYNKNYVYETILEKINDLVIDGSIDIPFPQLDVYIKEV